ncbi:DUF192 domain-containing protein [Sedimentitalea todarodis]|uniref:DUF192 domain-containing protein n=1 Tax=Sedimentitalea todarodis TaxID=1631240 RepID=A0ABU3VC54_9RHOB|nr:DUF192 domain-containing protein [Sedimentitalea todarodis]MDU9003751.1 DUF192 domain-containing protein [Sedimentitalea todarodis]
MMRLALLLAALMCSTVAAASACRDDHVQLRGSWGEAGFAVEVVDTPKARSQGLMFREALPRGSGMLFVYEAPRRASFWMKNTLIPLDMIFVDQSGTIKHVHHRAVPGDLTAIEGGAGIYAVLEINGGLAKRYGIEPGSQMQHPVFSDGPAIWPC